MILGSVKPTRDKEAKFQLECNRSVSQSLSLKTLPILYLFIVNISLLPFSSYGIQSSLQNVSERKDYIKTHSPILKNTTIKLNSSLKLGQEKHIEWIALREATVEQELRGEAQGGTEAEANRLCLAPKYIT